ncbi:MAG: hypothetical protein ACPGWR_17855 [Ardenticatenaceae bacterium]
MTMNVTRGAMGASVLLLLCAFLLSGCGLRPLLSDVRWEPHTRISPNADGIDDLTRLYYTIGSEALVTIVFESEDTRFVWRDQERRVAGEYEGWFSGVVNDGVLPDGDYQVRLIAESLAGDEQASETVALSIVDADTVAPEILNFEVTPGTISPNRDGVRDEAIITYWLSKPMEKVQVYVLGADGKRYAVPSDEIRDPMDEGGHTQRFDGGAGLGAVPPPDGEYVVVAKAQDKVGATTTVSTTLRLENGGIPLAQITRHDADFSTEILVLGETLFFTTTVTNSGNTAIRTHGPLPGTIYDSTVNYNNFNEPIQDGAWRLGLDFDGNPVYNGRRYPYRWQVGHNEELTEIDGELYLLPGQEVTVTGGLRLLEMPPRERPGFWIGLIHENVRFVEDFVGTKYITIEGQAGAPELISNE